MERVWERIRKREKVIQIMIKNEENMLFFKNKVLARERITERE